jgi:hypothetical protein
MAITKAEILESIEGDIDSCTIKISSLMDTGSISDHTNSLQIASLTSRISLLNLTKTWVEANL